MNCSCGGTMKDTKEIYPAKWGEYQVDIKGVKAYRCDACGKLLYEPEEINLLLNLTVLLSGLSKEKRPKVIDFEKFRSSQLID
ncbi:hypothetical protein Dred_1806 [Desulforamulus reducens MI-1]|uniref:YgiT-type zinc finger protein n=1 Tax=Desulforamulus reducens (strain ATCC BAA-1160 / DSM 100696 / MI-1) TaxID=349161 RepID=A4J5H8_DESRM|nr:YgiT-type zinc finger protein [Desulforamulus reducens]ABO50331.1 hypothetical protein Dred_1806 [Desulforamulus reducens MI-1]